MAILAPFQKKLTSCRLRTMKGRKRREDEEGVRKKQKVERGAGGEIM